MKKLSLFLFTILLFIPSFSFADSYEGPYCFEDVSLSDRETGGHSESGIRGTCKAIDIYSTVAMDPVLEKDYYLGYRTPILYDCSKQGCSNTRFSEIVSITSSSSLITSERHLVYSTLEQPQQVLLLDRKYFSDKLSALFKKAGIPFEKSLFPVVDFHIFQKNEYTKIKDNYSGEYIGSPELNPMKMDTLSENVGYYNENKYAVVTLLSEEYGKYIFGPKDSVVESQYTDFEKPQKTLSKDALGIKNIVAGMAGTVPVVVKTNPLNSINDVYLYTKKNGKLALAWQKTEYRLDDGSVKIITKDDKNVTAAMLFAGHVATIATSTSITISSTSTPLPVPHEKKHVTPVVVTAEEMGFFQKIINMIASLFK